jgi:hypothetical protein
MDFIRSPYFNKIFRIERLLWEEMRVLGFPHHKCWKDSFGINDGENSILKYIFDLTVLFTNTQKTCQMTANCLKIREVFTTTFDGIDFYWLLCLSNVVWRPSWLYASSVKNKNSFQQRNSLKFSRYWQTELQALQPNWHYQQ